MKHAATIIDFMAPRPEGVSTKQIAELIGLSLFGAQWNLQQLQGCGQCWSSNRGRGAVWRLGKRP